MQHHKTHDEVDMIQDVHQVTLEQWLTAIHVLQPALAKNPVSSYAKRLRRAGYAEVLHLKVTFELILVITC